MYSYGDRNTEDSKDTEQHAPRTGHDLLGQETVEYREIEAFPRGCSPLYTRLMA